MATIVPDPPSRSLANNSVADMKPEVKVTAKELPLTTNTSTTAAVSTARDVPKRPASPVKAPGSVPAPAATSVPTPVTTITSVPASTPATNDATKDTITEPDDGISMMGLRKKPVMEKFPVVSVPHPILPSGDLAEDVREHLKCHQMFANNVQTLLDEYISLKMVNSMLKNQLHDTDRQLYIAQSERDSWKSACEDANIELNEAREDYRVAFNSLSEANEKLNDITIKYNSARSEVKILRRDYEGAKRRMEGLDTDLKYRIERIRNLEEELRRANAGENAANDRNTELTRLLYQIESQKATIERQKDSETGRVRSLTDQIADRERVIANLIESNKKLQNPKYNTGSSLGYTYPGGGSGEWQRGFDPKDHALDNYKPGTGFGNPTGGFSTGFTDTSLPNGTSKDSKPVTSTPGKPATTPSTKPKTGGGTFGPGA